MRNHFAFQPWPLNSQHKLLSTYDYQTQQNRPPPRHHPRTTQPPPPRRPTQQQHPALGKQPSRNPGNPRRSLQQQTHHPPKPFRMATRRLSRLALPPTTPRVVHAPHRTIRRHQKIRRQSRHLRNHGQHLPLRNRPSHPRHESHPGSQPTLRPPANLDSRIHAITKRLQLQPPHRTRLRQTQLHPRR